MHPHRNRQRHHILSLPVMSLAMRIWTGTDAGNGFPRSEGLASGFQTALGEGAGIDLPLLEAEVPAEPDFNEGVAHCRCA
ncbi:hypothetical protein B0T16DRAFT_420986 [Cercophora newfieldiana]|uniref:Uncharacterized protein n=1 Tax=Cercophora newfieldiana TaxID=92897 RepID=A0AA39XZA0_9PEZI|nr:hypothetical protein B0T16DRAFT_420986 [Cercophora newfieldiana]